ncbi:MAG: magnesium transporter [Alphaproteobacteria bacterium]|nr:magnesium transporter [Alphaproteobacteria bacterium]
MSDQASPPVPEAEAAVPGLSPETLAAVTAALERGDVVEIRRIVAELHEADVAELIEKVPPDQRPSLIQIIRPELAGEVLTELGAPVLAEVVEQIGAEETAEAVAELNTDDAVQVMEELDDATRREVIDELDEKSRQPVEQALTYPEQSAGRLMQRDLISVQADWEVGEVIDYLRETSELPDDFYELLIVDNAHRPIGTVPLNRVLRSKRPVVIKDIMEAEPHVVPVDMDQEDVAYLFQRYDLTSVPVVDGSGKLVGVIMHDDIVDVIHEEHEEDLLKLGGVQESDVNAPVTTTVRTRVRWLLVTLINTVIAATVIHHFEGAIESLVALAVLMPIVAAMGGNAGMQTVTVIVRALATRELAFANAWRAIGKELSVGVINGLGFAALMGAGAALWFANVELGLVLAAAMVLNMTWAGLAGAAIPLALQRLDLDPAIASGPFLTTTTDVMGFLLFLGLASLFLV